MSDTAYYHGGVAGLRVGDRILPPAQTGAISVADLSAPDALQNRVEAVHRRDRVYLTTDITQARIFAACHPDGTHAFGGDVYRVTPEGDIEPDPDWLGEPGVSVCAPSAIIVGIRNTGVRRARYLPDLLHEAAAAGALPEITDASA